MIKILPALFAIVALTTLGCYAMSMNIDGAFIISIAVSIAGLGGYTMKTQQPKAPK
jgi:hypothetical protein